jgi:hypothetical protein
MLLHHEAEKVKDFIERWSFESILVSLLGAFILLWVAFAADPAAISGVFAMTVALSPLWLPVALIGYFWISWIDYIRLSFWFKREMVLLEVQLPPEVTKSPAAVEVFLNSIYTTGSETTFINRFWLGGFRTIWSLEIASNEGRIGYYIHCMKAWQTAVEGRIYGQFPEAKITEAEDYAAKVPFELGEWQLWGAEYKKNNDVQAYPIKTYVDFQLDKNPDTPEIQIDPMTNLFEIMNNVGKDEYLWLQIILKPRNNDEWYGIQIRKTDRLKDKQKAEIKKIIDGARKRLMEIEDAGSTEKARASMMNLTKDEQTRVEALEKMTTKALFEVGIRIIYLAQAEKFKGINGAFLFRIFQVLDSGMNRLGGASGRGMIRFDYPWEDFMGIRSSAEKRHLYSYYKDRAYFFVPYDQYPVFMNTEEIATLWHFPNSAVKTPGLNRVSSRVGDAPTNLPTLPS